MTRTPSFGVRALGGIAALSLALTGMAVVVASPAAAAPAVVYDSIPDPLPPAYSSLGFQATSTSAFGDYIQLGGGNRVITDVTVGLTNWACENWESGANPCMTTPGSGFDHPITLSIYEVDKSGTEPAVGALIHSVTEEKSIPYRPSASEECTDENADAWYDAATDRCYPGLNTTVTFDGLDALVGNDIIISVGYNTQSHGETPLGVSGPYNSLNVSLVNEAPTMGTDENPDEMFWDSTYLGRTPGLTLSTGWTGFFGLALQITAESVAAVDPLTEVTIYERDVKPNETAETYTEWHEGNPNGALDNSVVLTDGLHLGLGDPSTVIKGTDLAVNPAANIVTREQLRTLIERASVEVVSGTVTYQVPIFFGAAESPSFTTLRSTSLSAGSASFTQADTWATTRAFGSYGVQETAPLGELIDAVFDAAAAAGGGVALAGYGVQADSPAVVSSVVWDDTRYTFTQPVIEACEPTVGPEVTNLALGDWDFSETRTQGTNEFTADGLRVSTFGEPGTLSQAKAAGYAPIDIALSEVGTVGLDIASDFEGVRPSLQLGFDADGDGSQDAILVGEPWAYGGGDWTLSTNGDWADANFWVTGSNGFGVQPGGGYPALGTLDDFLLANPEARILNYGYSLGSGVVGEALIRSITVGCVTTPFSFELETLAPPTVDRLSGADRYATAVEISQFGFEDGEPDVVYIATGAGFADALSAVPAAAVNDAPLLLTTPNALPSVVRAELVRLAPSEVIIVGGTSAVSASVANAIGNLSFSPDVRRIAGPDRYATSRAIAADSFATADTAYIATGLNFPDALSAGPAAAEFDGPVVLVPGKAGSVDSATRTLLTGLGVTTVKIAGGTSAVSSGIQSQLSGLFTVTRNSGSDRYETAIAVNEDEFTAASIETDGVSIVFVATGENFADALTGAAMAGNAGTAIYVSRTACMPEAVYESILDLEPTQIVLLGGTSALSAAVENLTLCS